MTLDLFLVQGLVGEPSQPDAPKPPNAADWGDESTPSGSNYPDDYSIDESDNTTETKDPDQPMTARARPEEESIGPVASCRCHVVRSLGLWSGGYAEKQVSHH